MSPQLPASLFPNPYGQTLTKGGFTYKPSSGGGQQIKKASRERVYRYLMDQRDPYLDPIYLGLPATSWSVERWIAEEFEDAHVIGLEREGSVWQKGRRRMPGGGSARRELREFENTMIAFCSSQATSIRSSLCLYMWNSINKSLDIETRDMYRHLYHRCNMIWLDTMQPVGCFEIAVSLVKLWRVCAVGVDVPVAFTVKMQRDKSKYFDEFRRLFPNVSKVDLRVNAVKALLEQERKCKFKVDDAWLQDSSVATTGTRTKMLNITGILRRFKKAVDTVLPVNRKAIVT